MQRSICKIRDFTRWFTAWTDTSRWRYFCRWLQAGMKSEHTGKLHVNFLHEC